jgi:hypothetical protein
MLTHGTPSNRDAGNGLVESPSSVDEALVPASALVAGFISTAFISYLAAQKSVATSIDEFAGILT